jgi:hypothetical protein
LGKYRGSSSGGREGSEHQLRSDEEKVKDVVEMAKARCEVVLAVVRKADHILLDLVVLYVWISH